ncbi:MAG: ABC transporter permease [Thermoleophilia bacterium]|nr:ABC transporter permease [Thermoleophilia bacterium]
MSSDATAPATAAQAPPGPAETAPPAAIGRMAEIVVRSLVPVLLALVAGGLVLLALGANPIQFYADVWSGGMDFGAWQDTVMRMAPLALIACGLIYVFKAGIWNLGIDGQFLLAGGVIAGLAPELYGNMPDALMFLILFIVAGVVASVWTIVPALLRAHYGVNEIITSLMTSFIGINLANILIKGPFQDTASNVPQTEAIPFTNLLPTIPGTRIHVGVIVAAVLAIATWYAMSRTSFGLRLAILGANARAAAHVGISVPRLILVAFMTSGAFIGLAAAAEIMGIWGYVRADWNPAFGLLVVPLVFLARFNALATIPFVAALALMTIGGDLATQNAGVSNEFTLLLVGLVLLFMGVTELLGRRRSLGQSYLQGIKRRKG